LYGCQSLTQRDKEGKVSLGADDAKQRPCEEQPYLETTLKELRQSAAKEIHVALSRSREELAECSSLLPHNASTLGRLWQRKVRVAMSFLSALLPTVVMQGTLYTLAEGNLPLVQGPWQLVLHLPQRAAAGAV
jgi:hypothetical protein